MTKSDQKALLFKVALLESLHEFGQYVKWSEITLHLSVLKLIASAKFGQIFSTWWKTPGLMYLVVVRRILIKFLKTKTSKTSTVYIIEDYNRSPHARTYSFLLLKLRKYCQMNNWMGPPGLSPPLSATVIENSTVHSPVDERY